MLSLQEVVDKISSQTGLDNITIQQKIEDKKIELSGLISSEGAAHLVARDLNVDILTRVMHKLDVKNIVPGMRNTEITARIFRVFPTREFERNGSKGRVANVVLWDPTGTIRMSLWNDEIKILDGLKEGDVVKVVGYSKEDNRGDSELRLGNRGKIEKADVDFPPMIEAPAEQKGGNIGQLREGTTTNIRGALVQMFESDPFYEICPQCGIRVRANDNKFFCDEHQYVTPDYSMVLSGVIDDGTMSMRAVFFRDVAQKLLGVDVQTALSLARERMNRTAPITEKAPKILGRELSFFGRVKRNQMFDRLEFIVSDINEINVIEESNKILVSMDA